MQQIGSCARSVLLRAADPLSAMCVVATVLFSVTHAAAQSGDAWLSAIVCRRDEAQQIVSLLERKEIALSLAAAEALLENAQRTTGPSSSCVAQALFLQGTVLQVSGRIEDAGRAFDDAVAMFRGHIPPEHPAMSLALNNQGVQRFWMRRYREAARAHEEALEMRRSAVPLDRLAVADSAHNLADAYRYRDQPPVPGPLVKLYSEAITIRREILGDDDPLVANSLQNLASALELALKPAEASMALDEALRIYRKAVPRSDTLIAAVLNRKAALLFAQGRHGDAEIAYREATTLLRSSADLQKPTLAATLDDFAVNQTRLRKLEDARAAATEALAVRREIFPASHPTMARSLSTIADVQWLQGDFARSLETSRQAVDITVRASSSDIAARLRLQRHVRALWWAGGVPAQPKAPNLLEEAFRTTQIAMRTGTSNTVNSAAARAYAANERLRAALKDIDDIDRENARLEQRLIQLSAGRGSDAQHAFAEIRAALSAGAARKESVLAGIRLDFPNYDRLVRPEPIALAELQGLVAADEAVVVALVGLNEVYVWAVTREAVSMRQARVHPQDLEATISAMRKALWIEPTSKDRDQIQEPLFDLAMAHDLYVKLLGDIEPAIAGKPHLLIVPSGSLTSLPFHLLVRSKPRIAAPTRQQAVAYRDADYLTRRHAITVMPSVESLKALRSAPAPTADRKPLVAFANPLPSAAASQQQVAEASPTARAVRGASRKRGTARLWSGERVDLAGLRAYLTKEPLAETAEEAEFVARSLRADPSDVYTGAAATETKLKTLDLSKYRIVYFATHGFLSGSYGSDEPFLALTVPETASELDDGLLTASEITALKLDADLVVLSACDTAAGDRVGADGLSGLARAFFHAGARSLLVSHWSVDSLDTKALMLGMFADMSAKPEMRKSDALRRAMLARITGASGKSAWDAYPGRWGAFDLVGAD